MVSLEGFDELLSRWNALFGDDNIRAECAACGEAVLHLFVASLEDMASGRMDKSLKGASALVDLANESILLYHYKDVPAYWRQLLIDASLLRTAGQLQQMLDRKDEHFEMLEPLGMQLIWDLDLAMIVSGAPGKDRRDLGNNILDATQTWLSCHRLKPQRHGKADSLLTGDPSQVEILKPAIRLSTVPDVAWFEHHANEIATPFVIPPGALDHWPALTARPWQSCSYLLSVAADRVVPVEIGSRYTDADWQQKMMRFSDFVTHHIMIKDGSSAYLAQHDLLHQIPRLQDDIDIPDYCLITPERTPHYTHAPIDVIVNAWFGPRGTVSPLHHDPYHNLLAQVVGQKYVRLYAPDHNHQLYPHTGIMANTSQVDAEHPDLEQFPQFARAPYVECILQPGELLYIPPKWWHYVRSLDTSFSISFWF